MSDNIISTSLIAVDGSTWEAGSDSTDVDSTNISLDVIGYGPADVSGSLVTAKLEDGS